MSSFAKYMQHLETCLLTDKADRGLRHLVIRFYLSFSTGCTKWNAVAIKILLLFMAGLFIGFLVGKCAACQSHQKCDFGWHCFHFSLCLLNSQLAQIGTCQKWELDVHIGDIIPHRSRLLWLNSLDMKTFYKVVLKGSACCNRPAYWMSAIGLVKWWKTAFCPGSAS